MAILHSDSFNGMALDDPLWSSRNLDNALGGSGTLVWNSVSGAYIGSDGANRIYNRGTGNRALVSLGASADRLCRARVRFSAAGSLALLGRATGYDGTDWTAVRAVIGGSGDSMTTLKIQTVDSGNTATDRGTPATVTALSLNTDYWLVLKIVGSVVTAYLYAADGTSTVGALLGSCTYTLGSALSGAYWGLRYLSDGDNNAKFDDWIEEDVPVVATRRPVVVIM